MAGDTHHSKQKENKIKKGLWSPEEDEKLFNYIKRFGVGSWTSVPHLAGLERCGKSCRLRWVNYLRPGLKRGSFSQQEQDIIIQLHRLIGNRWAQIAAKLPGRTDNEIKNFWNSSLKKKLIKQGIDPNTHKPIHVSNECNKSIIPSGMAVEWQDAFHMNNNGGLTLAADNFMTSNLFLDESEMGIDPMGYDCNLLAQYQQTNCETSSPSFDFSDTLASRTMMNAFIKEESRESSCCTNYSNMNLYTEIFKYEEWNACEWQELQTVQASNVGDLDTYPIG